MSRRRIDRLLNDALKDFSLWLKSNQWRGKEHDCVNLFVHKFLLEKINPEAAIQHLTQINIECGLKQPKNGNYKNKFARKDLVIWREPQQNSWSEVWESANIPKVVMEWKVKFRSNISKEVFDPHDERWIRLYTEENKKCFGYIVTVDLTSEIRKVYWKLSRHGIFSKTFHI